MAFEKATIGALEQHIKDAFMGVFKGDYASFQSNNSIQQFRSIREQPTSQQTNYGPNMPQHNYPSTSIVTSRGQGGDLPEYGERGLPFAGGVAAAAAGASGVAVLTQQMGNMNMSGEAKPEPEHQKNIFDQALGKVKNFAKDAVDDVQDGIEAEVKKMAHVIDDVAEHIEEKVAEIGPELKEKISELIQRIHVGLADLLTKAALTCIKAFLGSAIKLKEIEEQAVEGVKDLAQMFIHQDGDPNTPGQQAVHPAAGLLSSKLSDGLTVIRGNSRHHFRDYLAKIEEEFFNNMPDGIKDILAKIFGGNPFDAKQNVEQQKESLGDKLNVFEEIGDKIKEIVERIQNALRDRVLEIVGGGHRRLEDRAWGNVQGRCLWAIKERNINRVYRCCCWKGTAVCP